MLNPVRRALRLLASTLLPLALLAGTAHGSVTVLVGEPFGHFGTLLPVGHVAIYLDHLCADGPLKLRSCRAGEPEGVVVARYHNLGRVDWMASPVLEFLYAVPRADEVPAHVNADLVWEMQQSYRREYLAGMVPDGHELDRATNEWWETAGTVYNRRLWGYQMDSTAAQDLRLMEKLNADANVHRFQAHHANCANFAADVVNLYYPGAVAHSNRIADLGFMMPKQVARAVAAYGRKHPETHLRVFEIAQVPGTQPRSRPVRGGFELGVKTKRYLFGMLAIQPEVPVVIAVLYGIGGRWEMGKGATLAAPAEFKHAAAGAMDVAGVIADEQTPGLAQADR